MSEFHTVWSTADITNDLPQWLSDVFHEFFVLVVVGSRLARATVSCQVSLTVKYLGTFTAYAGGDCFFTLANTVNGPSRLFTDQDSSPAMWKTIVLVSVSQFRQIIFETSRNTDQTVSVHIRANEV